MSDAHVYPSGCYFSSLHDIAGKRITVMGLGLNGGGEASVRFFLRHGAFVTATDIKSGDELVPTLSSLESDPSLDLRRLRLVLGRHDMADFANADAVIKNPGVKYEGNPYLAAAKVIETDISVFLSLSQAPVIAVTGSKGKSSTASAIHYGLSHAGFRSFLGGNITVSPLSFFERTDGLTPVVLELSSWQLADLRGRGVLKPKAAVLTKIVPDHQNWYGSMERYVADKKLIYADQDSHCWTICESPENDTESAVWGGIFGEETPGTPLYYADKPPKYGAGYGAWFTAAGKGVVCLPPTVSGEPRIHAADGMPHAALDRLRVPGRHMRVNVLNAALVMSLFGAAPEQTAEILAQWPGIEHRLEFFHEWANGHGARAAFYNDSAATVPEAAAAALSAFSVPLHLICGGADKNLNFEPLAQALSSAQLRPASLWLLAGSGTDKLCALLEPRGVEVHGPYDSLETLLCELRGALSGACAARGEQAVVFSPGATSFNMFRNEFDRGAVFKELVRRIFS